MFKSISKVVVLVICDDGLYFNGEKTINSLKYFHPEFKIIKLSTQEINKFRKELNCDWLGLIAPNIMKTVWDKEQPDLLIKIGADCIVLDTLNEILDSDYDVACGRNDSDLVGDRDEKHNRPDIIRDIPNHEWVNADLVCIKNYEFLLKYVELTDNYRNGKIAALKDYGKFYKGDDQSSLNVVFRLYGFKSLILDPVDSDLIYGASGNWYIDNNSWDSWKYIFFDGKKSIMPNFGLNTKEKIVKVLHACGGTQDGKLNNNLFNPDFRKYLENIINIYD
jgi:hypothetical protein